MISTQDEYCRGMIVCLWEMFVRTPVSSQEESPKDVFEDMDEATRNKFADGECHQSKRTSRVPTGNMRHDEILWKCA
jgi:hypothetical protein